MLLTLLLLKFLKITEYELGQHGKTAEKICIQSTVNCTDCQNLEGSLGWENRPDSSGLLIKVPVGLF